MKFRLNWINLIQIHSPGQTDIVTLTKLQPVTVVVAVDGGVGCGGAVVEGAVTIVAAEEDDEGPEVVR